jgi:hypothetical protein
MAVFASVYKYLLSYSIHCESCPHVTTTQLFIVHLCVLVQEKVNAKKKLLEGPHALLHKIREFRVYALNMSFKVC